MNRQSFASILFLLSGAVTMLVMSAHYLVHDTTGILTNKPAASNIGYLITFRCHVLFGLVAIFTMPFQLNGWLRRQSVKWHRKIGLVYLSSVFIGSLSGLVVAQFAMGGVLVSSGFSVLAVVWAYTGYMGLTSALRGSFNEHRLWMYRSAALTFAAITQRLMLLIPLLTSIEFMDVYRLSAWLPWMINLALVEWLIGSGNEVTSSSLG